MKLECVLPHPQQSATCSYSEPYQFSRYPFRFLEIHFNNVLPPAPRSSKWSLSFSFPHQTGNSPLPYIYAACPVYLIIDTAYLKPTLILIPVQKLKRNFYKISHDCLNVPEDDCTLCTCAIIYLAYRLNLVLILEMTKHPDWLWGPSCLLFSRYRVSLSSSSGLDMQPITVRRIVLSLRMIGTVPLQPTRAFIQRRGTPMFASYTLIYTILTYLYSAYLIN